MKISKKTIFFLCAAVVVFGIVFAICLNVFFYGYNDKFVVGNDMTSIQERYGEFDTIGYNENNEIYYAAYLVKEDDAWGNPATYYAIFFENGVAISAEMTGPLGG